MQRILARWRVISDERGQAVVELAIVMVILFTLVFGAVEVGRMVNAWAIVTQASREGARVGAATCTLDPGCAGPIADSIEHSLAGLAVADARWNIGGGPYRGGDPLTVQVEYDLTPFSPMIRALVPGGTLTVHSETTMRLE